MDSSSAFHSGHLKNEYPIPPAKSAPGTRDADTFPPVHPSFPDLFEAQAARVPDALALLFDQEQITYQELNTRANRLAHFLQAQGIGAETRVGISMERSPAMIIALLAILKAGGAYVPLDPSYPQERLHFMLQDAHISLLLTQEAFAPLLSAPTVRVIMMDRDAALWQNAKTCNPVRSLIPENLAYLIYTSGSTGRPKGTLLTHHGLGNLIAGLLQNLQITMQDRILHIGSLSFDVSVAEITLALSAGAVLCLQKQEDILPGRIFLDLLQRQAISIAFMVPSFLRRLPPADLPDWRALISGGEACTPDLVACWANGRQFFNAYAPTEATVCATMILCQPGDTTIALGNPLPNLQLYVLDESLQPVLPGKTGELYLGGAGLARGYYNLPAITAERFIPDPFAQQPGQRLYKTGDLARLMADGRITFLGREDTQIKLRGFRIELGEIEHVLRGCNHVQDVVVLCREDAPEDHRLVAYAVPRAGCAEQLSPSRLDQHARAHLPGYMLPAHYILLPAFPLTPSAKVDRQALPAPDSVRPELATPFVPPSTPIEQKLEDMCTEILRVERLGVNDNFFELGGNSLLIAQVTARIESTFGIRVPPAAFFAEPSISGLAHYIEQYASNISIVSPALEIPVLARDGQLFPVSFSQERVWFLQELEPDNKAYHAQAVFRFSGKLNIDALERSLQAIFYRHEIFRTTFPVVEGVPHQQIHPTYTLHLPVIDLEALSAFEREQHVQSIIQQELETPFDVAVLPLARWTLIRLEPQRHLLLHIEHHLVHDGWSFAIFLRDLQAFYQAFATDAPLQLPPLPIQFVDFVVWQRRWMQGVEGERQLRYWQNVLSDAPAMLELPTDYPRPTLQSFRGASLRIVLPNELQRKIRELCRREGTTLYMTLFSAFVTLLARYTGQTDICVGAGVANRRLAVTEPIIGMIINTVVLRTRVEDDPTFRTLLKRVRQITLEAYEHQDLPFGRVVESLRPQRSLSHSPLYQVAFSFHDAPSPDLRLPGLSVELEEAISNGSAKFDLNIVVIPRAEQQRHFSHQEERDELIFVWEYNTDLFKEETIRFMAGVYQTLLESVYAHPEQHISALPLLTPEQRQQQLVDWNSLHTHYPAHQCIHQAFETQVECTPHAPALLFANMTLTYAQLNQAANQLARYLRGCGVQPGDLVGLYMERSLDLIVAMVGILKAGAAYVPIDLAYPPERMAFIIQDTHMGVLLTQETLYAQLPGLNIQVISLDQARTRIEQEARENMVCEVQAEDLAYVIYTSGSTGIPKGVAIPHHAVMRLVLQTNYIQFEPADRVAQASNTSFDAATYEIWGALLNGATLVGVPREVSLAPRAFAAFLESQHISVLFLTTALFNQIAQEVPGAFRTLRHLSFGGEAVDPNRVKIILTAGRPEYLLHVYGPTENTTFSTWYAVEDVPEAALTVPIGAPIANSQAFVLDHQMHLVPPGCPGELYLGGDGLAQGYWNRPDLTSEHFVPHPFSSRPGARLYRTGDLVRARADGQLEFLGRVDFQVKVRGFRIEPGEIEVILSQHPDIHEAVVLLREDAPEEKRLVAYLVPKPERMPNLRQLRQHLQARLPDYMLPSALVILERLPLNPNGKLDRRALPSPEYSNPDLEAQYAPPRNHAEELLTAIWAEVLGREHVGIYDNFFESGGHSLLATRVISRIQQVFQVTLPLRSLFEHPYVAELATAVTQIHSRPDDLALTKRSWVADREKVLPLSFAQQRLWFLDKLVPGNPFYNICRAISLSGDLQIEALEQSLHELVRRHESLRTHFSLLAEQPVQVISPLLPLPVPLVDLSGLLPSQREAVLPSLAAQQAACPFVLSQAPLLRACLLRLEPREHVLLLCLHHIICDGWSLDIFFRELSSLYTSSSTRRPCSLPALSIQYADYTLWQRDRFAGSLLHEQLSYWRKQLADLPPLALPTDHPRPLVQRFRGAYQRLQFPASLTRQLKDLSQHEQVTLFMTLLAGFQILLARCCRQEDIAVGTPIANRTRPELEGLIGFFVNTLVLRTDLSGDPSVRELLSRVREVALGAYAHQDLPFEQLVEELHIERTLSTNPLFQVLLALQNTPQETLELPELKLHFSSIHSGTTKLDLHISFWEEREGLSGVVEYSTDLFEADTIHRLLGHYQQILEGMVANPGQRISRLSLLTENERKQLLAWNATQRTVSQQLCPHELFEAQVERTPDSVAVVYGQAQITYQELNARADQLARHLRTLGVGPERRVGICLDRSPELVIALLGVLKSGGAYVPLDPDYPAERLIFMLQDSQVSVLLTRSSLRENLPNHNFTAVYLDTQWSTIASAPARETRRYLAESNLAYVIYTSGSTGLPKGVAMHHGALTNLLAWQLQAFPTGRAARTLQFTSPGFDVSFQELFSTWCSGGTLVLLSEEVRRDTHALLSFLNIAAIERIFLPFVALEHLALTSATRKLLPTTLREIITAGEQLQATEAIVNFLRHLQECSLYNQYGPTETHVVTAFPLRGSPENWPALPPIGSPITNTQIFLLDQYIQQVPIGVPGELYIGGDQVARGYLNRPDLTAERFVPDPYGQQPGARLYRTGDLARYRSDGTIEFLGRIDHQVKLRGYRIETGEIEAVLRQQPGVREAVVRVRESAPGDKRLIAYVVPDQGQHPPSLNELRQFLQARLPGYMIPAAFVSLEKLPLTPSGKIDHRALPLPERARNEMDVSYVPPGSPIEESLATIWAALLKVDQVGIHDNFFLSGGHSLLAIRLISRIYEAFQAELSVLDIFEASTIAQQSSIIVRKHAERADSETVSQLLAEIEQISEEETQAFLASQQLQNETERESL